MHAKKIALLVFALSAEEEVKNKPFLAENSLAKTLHAYTHEVATKSGLPVVCFDETKQSGTTFGSRFANAIQSVYDQGYDAVIAIGSDCPYLKVDHIITAKNALQNGSSVLGSTYDGGFYLIGLSQKQFNSKTFATLSWNTNHIYKEVREELEKENQNCIALQKLHDLDFLSELKKLPVSHIHNFKLKKAILNVLHKPSFQYIFKDLHRIAIAQAVIFNKGSPDILSFL